jgi:hypothetical protein
LFEIARKVKRRRMTRGRDPDNKVVLTAEQFFPSRRDEILQLRRRSSVFDEICHDLELMAGLLQDQATRDSAAIESFEGLKEEVSQALVKEAKGV